jgi:hypothetical protein
MAPTNISPPLPRRTSRSPEVVSDIKMRCRVQPQQLHEFPTVFVEKSSRAAGSCIRHDKADIEIACGIGEYRKETTL